MTTPHRIGYALVAAGIGVGALSLGVGGTTDLACPGIDSAFYDRFGVLPGEANVVSVAVLGATLEWHDGCNRHTQSVLTFYVGLLVALGGVAVLSREAPADGRRG